jgi:hypothetical protein
MRIDSSGFVGIGTTSPTTPLQVNGTITAPLLADTLGGSVAPSSSVMRNRIINGAMVIDQRNAGASVTQTTSNLYTVDRFFIGGSVTSKFTAQQNAGSVTPPAGFTNYLGCTSSSAYSVDAGENFVIIQRIEGYNIADLGWGSANAKTITLSFWVRSSLTGTFGGALRNSAANRSYPYSYTISSANTWEQKFITITGDTSGTWLTTNGVGVQVVFSLGSGATLSGTAGAWAGANYTNATGATSVVGTSGATFYITGVQLEVGTQATSFEYRQYQQELALCQRYYYKIGPSLGNDANVALNGFAATTTIALLTIPFPTTMRTAPSALEQSGTAGDYAIRYAGASVANCSAVPTFQSSYTSGSQVGLTIASGLTAGGAIAGRTGSSTGNNAFLAWSAEL